MKKIIKKIILATITGAMALLCGWGISCLDSDIMIIPILASVIGGAWVFFFFYANDWFLKVGEK